MERELLTDFLNEQLWVSGDACCLVEGGREVVNWVVCVE